MVQEGLCRVLLPLKAHLHGVHEKEKTNLTLTLTLTLTLSQGVREHVAFVGTGINLHYLYY